MSERQGDITAGLGKNSAGSQAGDRPSALRLEGMRGANSLLETNVRCNSDYIQQQPCATHEGASRHPALLDKLVAGWRMQPCRYNVLADMVERHSRTLLVHRHAIHPPC